MNKDHLVPLTGCLEHTASGLLCKKKRLTHVYRKHTLNRLFTCKHMIIRIGCLSLTIYAISLAKRVKFGDWRGGG